MTESLTGQVDLRPANCSKMAIVLENFLMPAQDGVYDDRFIGVADLRMKSGMMSVSITV